MVYGNAGEKRVRDVAAEFERFREAMSRVLPKAGSQAAVPTIVVVFDSKRSYDTYRPMFNGKRVDVSGYFQPTEEQNLVTLSLEDREQAFRILFHEYAHLVVSNVAHNVPVWANEGLAEYYSTFQLSGDGRQGSRPRT
jgi:hypothetical protein